MNVIEKVQTLYNKQLQDYSGILNKLNEIISSTGEFVEGNSFYLHGIPGVLAKTYETKRLNLFYYGMQAHNILEVGFNGGHSCLLFLLANTYSKIQIFDLGEHAYSKLCFNYLNNMFPGRLSIVWGDSTQTLPKFETTTQYDVMHVDGGHTKPILLSDINNCCRLSNHNTYMIIDDISFHPVHMFKDLTTVVVEKFISTELVQEIPPFYSAFHVIAKLNKNFKGVSGLCESGLPTAVLRI